MHLKILLRCATAGVLLSLMTLSSCAAPKPAPTAHITGTATYRERMLLPPGARLEVTLEDVSRADARADTVAQTYVDSLGAPPFEFTITYDQARIVENHRYSVRARILANGALLFHSDTSHAVLGAAKVMHVDLVLQRAAAAVSAAAPPTTRMRGMYSYMADAGWFTDCLSGARLPVAQEADNAALEKAYGRVRPMAGAALLATVEGYVENRMPMEGNAAKPTLIVERFHSVTQESCSGPGSTAQLENTYWKLMTLGDAAAESPQGAREIHFVLQSAGKRVTGFAGCNRMMGSYVLNGGEIKFSQMGGTMMACTTGMELEQKFHQVFPRVARWKIAGETLKLHDAGGVTLATFESRYMK